MPQNVLEYLEKCIAETPRKHALSMREDAVTFSELGSRARRYAAAIAAKSDEKNCPVGVFCPRSIEPIIAFLGVLYSGNFYVPLDPEAPSEKIKAIIEDAGLTVILGTANEQKIIDALGFAGSFITAGSLPQTPCTCSLPAETDLPLYMVYTSGSTGKPKGVLKSHQAEISFIEAYCDTFDFSKDDVIGNQTPFYFDAAAKDIYLMLKMGITMEIIPTELFALPPELIDYLNQKRITFASWVPTALSIVATLCPFSMVVPHTLKRVFFVGEVMPMKHLNKWRAALPDIQYVNLYGQSELCGICCYYEVRGSFENDAVLPMGKPLKNCALYLLADDQVVTQPGQTGELYIVSDALAMCYYHDPEKTGMCFLEKDFGHGPQRCFKTGDLARFDENGNLVFASRADFQIKHAGHRIELGEIETVAGSLPQIARCCCLYNAEKKKIHLFCELAAGQTASGVELRSQLKTRLSAYMVPTRVTVMEKLPLNANGKIDRQKLKMML